MSRRPLPPGIAPSRTARLASDLNSVAIHLLRRIAQDDAADGITPARASALSVLVYGGPSSLGELARRERVAVPTMSRLVEGMVRDRLVTRRPAAGDRRAVVLTATARGRTLMERGRARRIAALAAGLDALEPDDLTVLERAVDLLARLAAAPPPAPLPRTTSARSPKERRS
ncbi:MAG TPA: MarR family winged helix-turn-helix transcriptional regulator [Vicinamibacterales bacterium]